MRIERGLREQGLQPEYRAGSNAEIRVRTPVGLEREHDVLTGGRPWRGATLALGQRGDRNEQGDENDTA